MVLLCGYLYGTTRHYSNEWHAVRDAENVESLDIDLQSFAQKREVGHIDRMNGIYQAQKMNIE